METRTKRNSERRVLVIVYVSDARFSVRERLLEAEG